MPGTERKHDGNGEPIVINPVNFIEIGDSPAHWYARRLMVPGGFLAIVVRCHRDKLFSWYERTGYGDPKRKTLKMRRYQLREVAQIFHRLNPSASSPVLLCASQAGDESLNTFGRDLSGLLGVPVYAPTEDFHCGEDGRFFVSDKPLAELTVEERSPEVQAGKWVAFNADEETAELEFDFELPKPGSAEERDGGFERFQRVPSNLIDECERFVGRRVRLEREYPTDEVFEIAGYFLDEETLSLLGFEIESLEDPRIKMSLPGEQCVFVD